MASFVLILIFYHGYGIRPTVVFEDFTSAQNCEVAKQVSMDGWKDDQRFLLKARCVSK